MKKNVAIVRYLKKLQDRIARGVTLDISSEFREANLTVDTDSISDGYHTFGQLYDQRLYLSAALCNAYPTLCWKSKCDENGKPWFNGRYFLICFETSAGQFSYHYTNDHWNLFQCQELEKARHFDGHTCDDVRRLLYLSDEVKDDRMDKEIGLYIKSQVEEAGEEDKSFIPYVIGCVHSAKRAYDSLCRDGHSGMSINVTKVLLDRMIQRKPLTPLTNNPDEWGEPEFHGNHEYSTSQNKRYSALFKDEYADGTIRYHDINRYVMEDIHSHLTYQGGPIGHFLNCEEGIQLPYMPEDKSIIVETEDFLMDEANGDFDHAAMFAMHYPDGHVEVVNRYFRETEDADWKEITEQQYKDDRVIAEARGHIYWAHVTEASEENQHDLTPEQVRYLQTPLSDLLSSDPDVK